MNGEGEVTRVRDIMRREFVYFDEEDTVDRIIDTFAKFGIHEAPVVSRGTLTGMVSDREVAYALLDKGGLLGMGKGGLVKPERASAMKARQIMARGYFQLGPEMGVTEAIADMSRRRINVIPVVEGGKLIGIVTGYDIIKYLSASYIKHELGQKMEEGIQSLVDKLMALVDEKDSVSTWRAAKELGIPQQRIEIIAKSLAARNLIAVSYTISGAMKMRRRL